MDNPSETMEDIALINNLNDHCLKHIFSFLPLEERLGIEKVCKRWQIIGEQGWDDIKTLKISEDDSDDMIYLLLKRCGRYLRHLKIHYTPEHPHSLSIAIEFCRLDQLEEIELTNLNYRDHRLREFFEKSRKLVAVTLQGLLWSDVIDYLDFLNPKTLRKLHLMNQSADELSINPDRFPNLKELTLHDVCIIEDEVMREEESLKGLEEMKLYYCNIPKNFLQRICTFTNLKVLGLGQLVIELENEDIRHIARHCNKIKEMIFLDSIYLGSNCFQYLGEMRSLEVLNFEYYAMNTHNLLYLTNVRKIIFYGIEDIVMDNGLIELIVNSSNLEELELIKIHGLGRTFLDKIGRIFQNGRRTKHLIVTVKGRRYERLNGLEELTYHPLLNLKINNDFHDSEGALGSTYDDDDDDDDDYDDDDDDTA